MKNMIKLINQYAAAAYNNVTSLYISSFQKTKDMILSLAFFASITVLVIVKAPLNVIISISGFYPAYPIVSGLSACLIYIVKKCIFFSRVQQQKNTYDVTFKEIFIVFMIGCFMSVFILMCRIYFDIFTIIIPLFCFFINSLELMPLSVEIPMKIRDKLSLFMEESKSSSGKSRESKSTVDTPEVRTYESPFSKLSEVFKIGVEIRELTGQLSKLQDDMIKVEYLNNVKVIQTPNGDLTIDVPANLSVDKENDLAMRVRIIDRAFNAQSDKIRLLADKGTAIRQKAMDTYREKDLTSLSEIFDIHVRAFENRVNSYNSLIGARETTNTSPLSNPISGANPRSGPSTGSGTRP